MWPFKSKQSSAKPVKQPKPAASTIWRTIHRTRGDMTLRGNESIYAAVSRISNTMASMPLHLYRGWEIARGHPLEALIGRQPNVNMSGFGFVQTMEACRNTEGNGYALILRDGLGAVDHLDVLDPTRVRPQKHPKTGEIWYYVTMDDGKMYPLPGSELLVLRFISANGEAGIRPLDVLAGTLDYDRSVKEFSLNQLDGVNQGIFLEVPSQGLSSEIRDSVIDSFLDAYKRSGQRVVVLEGGMKASTFGQSPVSAQVLDVERVMRNRVATVYNIPPHLLGDYTDTSFATAEQQMLEYYNLTILPICRQWEQELDRKLLTAADLDDGYHFAFDVSALRRADTATMANRYQMAIRGGWMSPNEVREREGLPPAADGDHLMASRDLLPLSISVEHPEMLLGTAASSGGDGGENK